MVRKIQAPECLGKISKTYCVHCSEVCPLTALCVLMSLEIRFGYKWGSQGDSREVEG